MHSWTWTVSDEVGVETMREFILPSFSGPLPKLLFLSSGDMLHALNADPCIHEDAARAVV